MRNNLLAGSVAAILLCAPGIVAAQDKADQATKEDLKKTDPLPPATGRNLPEQAGTTEPSSKVKTSEDENVFANGVLAVPGAQTDVDTAPAKFSQRTTADDSLPIIGYRMKLLSPEQRQEILQGLTAPNAQALSPGSNEGYAVIGRGVPAGVGFQALTPVPADLATKFTELRGTGFMNSDGKVVIVDLDNNLVVGVLGG